MADATNDTSTLNDPIVAAATTDAVGGNGGSAYYAVPNGGAGGAATSSANARGTSFLAGDRAEASGRAQGGRGGDYWGYPAIGIGGTGGDATSASLASIVMAFGGNRAVATDSATGGAGGNGDVGRGGSGGKASSSATASLVGSSSTAAATGSAAGNGGASDGTGGAGGGTTTSAISETGSALATAGATGPTSAVTTSARTSGGIVTLVSAGTPDASTPVRGVGLTTSQSAVGIGGPLTRGATAYAGGFNAAAYATGLPAAAEVSGVVLGNPNVAALVSGPAGSARIGYAALGGARGSQIAGSADYTYVTQASFSLDANSVVGSGDAALRLGLLDATFGSAAKPFKSLTFEVTEDGAAIGTWSFTDFVLANAFFSDNVVGLGSWRTAGETSLDLRFTLTLVTDAAGQAFYAEAIVAAPAAPVPLPGTLWLSAAALACLGGLRYRRRETPATARPA